MELCFEVLCLTLHAEIAPVTPDEYEDGEMQFLTLTCDGKDASFLFTSDVLTEMICEAAWGGVRGVGDKPTTTLRRRPRGGSRI